MYRLITSPVCKTPSLNNEILVRWFSFRCIDGADDDLFWMYFTVCSVDDYDDNNKEGDTELETPNIKTDATSNIDLDRDSACRSDNGIRQCDRDRVDNEGVSREYGRQLTVVTNDEMRNHRMALLEPVPFKR